MTDRDSFIRAICECPEDDVRRLAFADFLDENGAPERAEFIRAQVELTRRGFPGPLSHRTARLAAYSGAKSEPLPEVAFRLLCEHGADWLGDPFILVEPVRAADWAWGRGFLEKITCTADEFLTHAAALFGAHPITEVVLTDKRTAWHSLWNADLVREAPTDENIPETLFTEIWNLFPLARQSAVAPKQWLQFGDSAGALDALSAGCVAHGRKLADLPPLAELSLEGKAG